MGALQCPRCGLRGEFDECPRCAPVCVTREDAVQGWFSGSMVEWDPVDLDDWRHELRVLERASYG